MGKKKDTRSDIELAAEGAANIYNAGKQGVRLFKRGLGFIKPNEQRKVEKLRAQVSNLAMEKKALDEAYRLRKAKEKLEQEIREKKRPPELSYA